MAQPQSLTIREEELPTLLFTAGKNFAQKHYMLSGSWMIGLLICFFARGFTPDIEVVAQYEVCQESVQKIFSFAFILLCFCHPPL